MKKNEIHPYCQRCLKDHSKDWYLKNGKVFCRSGAESKFDNQICSLIHEEIGISEEAKKLLGDSDVAFANFLHNSTLWSRTELDWTARWYQDYMMKCTALRKVSRIGRRAGKTEAISVKMIHYAYTHEHVTVLVIAPYKNQVGLIFDKLDTLISKSESIRSSIKRNTKNPYRLELHNGSKILGFTSGTRTGSKSTGIRGQDAHMIVIDEADYLSPSDFEVILAIQASRPDVLIWASSTPTGKREMFWRFCTDIELGYKEFHFPSSVSPSWNEQTERLEKAQYSEAGYKHEFEAEFGDVAEGVFLKKHVDASLQEYDFAKVRRNVDSLYTMGVDWNTAGNGTCIIITEWNKNLNGGKGAFKAVLKRTITQEEFTQVRSCEEIIKLNDLWNPEHIYVDEGYGHTQIEMLRKYGIEHPLTGLANKIKGIYFGDRMEIRDPVTKQIVKKHMKPFIVNLAARRMEDGQIILPDSEDIKNGLVGQIRDYMVIRTTAMGQPVYSDENDHSIIAWMLCILGATMEHSDMVRQNRLISVALAGKFGEKTDPDFKVSKMKSEQEKRERVAITPRWFSKPVFQEQTARNTLDFIRSRERKAEGRQSIFSIGKLRRAIKSSHSEGRKTF